MNDVAKEYGAALFLLACEENQKKEYEAALNTVKNSFLEHPDFLELLNSPALSMAERLSVIDTVFAENLPQRVLSFLKLLCEKGRISCFPRQTAIPPRDNRWRHPICDLFYFYNLLGVRVYIM